MDRSLGALNCQPKESNEKRHCFWFFLLKCVPDTRQYSQYTLAIECVVNEAFWAVFARCIFACRVPWASDTVLFVVYYTNWVTNTSPNFKWLRMNSIFFSVASSSVAIVVNYVSLWPFVDFCDAIEWKWNLHSWLLLLVSFSYSIVFWLGFHTFEKGNTIIGW